MNILESFYYIGLYAKRYISLKKQKRLPCNVISIGNITVGGTGKTPAAIALAEEAQKRGLRPVILTRGYKGSAKGPCFVTRGDGPLMTAEQAGDEPVLMAERLRGVPIVKAADRYGAGMFAIEAGKGLKTEGKVESAIDRTVFILDDGFQHWRLHRDKDIVLIDGRNPFGNRRLLPAGRLREPLTGLKRADIIMVTKAERQDASLTAEIRRYNNSAPVFFSGHNAASIRSASGQGMPLESLRGQRVCCFCGLADPGSFFDTVEAQGAVVACRRSYPDHHLYSQKDIRLVDQQARASGARFLVTTEKDMVKLRSLDLPENILIIGIAFTADRPFFDSVFA